MTNQPIEMLSNKLTIEATHALCVHILMAHGCNLEQAEAVADTITAAERDGAHSHGLFRLNGYVNALKMGLVNGEAKPSVQHLTDSIIQVNGHNCFAPLAQNIAKEPVIEAARKQGLAALSLIGVHHFSALWKETEMFAEEGLAAFAFTAYTSSVVPHGGSKPFFGTNPMSFAWPRKNGSPMVFDQASAAMARGDVMIAARDGKDLPLGVGIDPEGQPTTDPNEVLKGGMLPFGGHKGSSIALMIELLVGPLIGEASSFQTDKAQGSKAPVQGGEFMIVLDPNRFGNAENWSNHAELLFETLLEQEGTRLPGSRRHNNRQKAPISGITINDSLKDQLQGLLNEIAS